MRSTWSVLCRETDANYACPFFPYRIWVYSSSRFFTACATVIDIKSSVSCIPPEPRPEFWISLSTTAQRDREIPTTGIYPARSRDTSGQLPPALFTVGSRTPNGLRESNRSQAPVCVSPLHGPHCRLLERGVVTYIGNAPVELPGSVNSGYVMFHCAYDPPTLSYSTVPVRWRPQSR
jgi:hypothetical protein